MDRSRISLEAALIEKAWEDEKFRTELIANPKGVIENRIGQALPQGMQIQVVEETEDMLYLIIPANPEKLPDEILDLVAGGGGESPDDGRMCCMPKHHA